jgi:hypothetical protein
MGFGFEAVHTAAKREALMHSILNYLRGLTGVAAPRPLAGLLVAYSLSQNYPNPFNPSTTIRFDLPSAARVSLAVYDLTGRLVERLLDRTFEAGSFTIPWTADVASGVYYYRLEASGVDGASPAFSQTRKLVVLR